MINQITPPLEMVQQWGHDADLSGVPYDDKFWDKDWTYEQYIADRAAQWGAYQELEACCQYISNKGKWFAAPDPRLKEQALKALKVLPTPEGQVTLDITDLNTIRRALEQLND